MSDIQRPEHAVSVYERLQRRVEAARDRAQLRLKRRPASVPEEAELAVSTVSTRPIASMMPGVLAGAVCVLIGLSGVWAWQSWSNRVSEPIDDRLPMLFVGDAALEPSVASTDSDRSVNEDTPSAEPITGLEEPLSSTLITEGSAESPPANESPLIVVHVAGAVVRAGVVELGAGARVIDAVQAAGGAGAAADLDRVNLAALISDGERIHVPTIGEEDLPVVIVSSSGMTSGAGDHDEQPLMLDINTASAESLEALPGVGPSTAAAIVRTRESRGPFLAVKELLEVPGIGEAKLSQMEPFVVVRR